MGNFDNERLEKLEKQLLELKAQNHQIINENLRLKAMIESQPQSNRNRELIPLIDKKKYDYLFNFDANPDTGEIVSASVERKATNFTNLARYIMQVFKPTANRDHKGKRKFYLKHPAMCDFTNIEWEIVKSSVLKIIDVLDECKQEYDKIGD